MDKTERKGRITMIANDLFDTMTDMACWRNDLEGIGCKKEAKLLDTIVGKLNLLCEKLNEKAE